MPMMSSKRSIRMLFDFLVLSILFFSYLCMISSHAADTITLGQQLRDGQTLVSSGDNFELGFFSPGSSKNRYLGIWYNYKKVSEPTVVWVGNRDNPLFDSSGFLTIDNNGNLMISDEKGSSVMMTSLSLTANTSAQLLDSGNLILRDSYNERQIFWQSFDHPTNTLLPGMKFGYNKKTKQNGLLRAWKNLEEASPGTFAFGADPNGTEQYFIWQRGDIYWTSGVWNGEIFSLVPEMSQTDIFGYSFVSNEDENYFTYYVKNVSIISRLVIDPSGQILQLTWLENRWNLFWSQPHHVCDAYLVCGAYSSCDPNGSPSCSCLIGFEPRFPRGWALRDWSGGCVRQRSLTCGNGDMFQRLKSMKLPDQSQLAGWALTDSTVGDDVCEAMCMGNCSCVAYARYNTTGCLVWDGDLLGLQSNYQGGGGAQDFFIRLASSEQDGQGNKGRWLVILAIVVLIVAIVAPIIAFSASVICYMQRRRMEQKRKKQTSQELLLLELGTNTVDGKKFGIPNNSGEGGKKDREFQLFSFLSIEAATDNFSTKNKLGEGGFGPVYKGKLHGEQEIAVKRLSRSSGQGLVEFKNEILLIAKLQHMNLVRLLGCCIEGEEKLLIYEYMPNKSLDSFLFDSTKQAFLDWGKRLHIVEGIAQGLLYLHRYSRLRIIHRDMKASNILLDGDMNPKISDFGMARIFGREESQANTNRVVGTYGYMPPEYVMEGLFSEKSDVFSFGVLLLEIVSGKKISGFYQSNNSLTLLGYAWELWMNGRGLELMDRTLGEPSPMWKLTRCIHVALLCVQERATDRPNMSDVIAMLGNETAVLPSPKQPAFSTRSVIDTNLERSKPEICSLNEVTISVLEAR